MVDWRLRCVLNILTAFASQQRHKLADKQKQQLADRVQSVINEILLENKLTPTQQAIAKKIGTTERALCIAQYHNSYLNDVLENAKSIQRSKVFENLEIEYTNRAQDLLNNALANNQIPTQSVIAESFGMSPASLINRAKSMPALRKVLDEAVRISRQMHSARKEYEALLLVKTAAQRLYFQKGLDFTMEELAREAGRTYQALHVYPTVQLFMAYLSEAKRTKVQMTGDDFTC